MDVRAGDASHPVVRPGAGIMTGSYRTYTVQQASMLLAYLQIKMPGVLIGAEQALRKSEIWPAKPGYLLPTAPNVGVLASKSRRLCDQRYASSTGRRVLCGLSKGHDGPHGGVRPTNDKQ